MNRTVDACGYVMIGCPPETMKDSYRRGCVPLSNSKLETGLSGFDSGKTHIGLTAFRSVRPWAFSARCQKLARTA